MGTSALAILIDGSYGSEQASADGNRVDPQRAETIERGVGLHRPLRVNLSGINYRMLYFFHGQVAAVLSHGLVKEKTVPPVEIDRAVSRKQEFEKHPSRFMHREEA